MPTASSSSAWRETTGLDFREKAPSRTKRCEKKKKKHDEGLSISTTINIEDGIAIARNSYSRIFAAVVNLCAFVDSGRSVGRSAGRSVGRSVDRSVDWSVGRSIGRSVGRSLQPSRTGSLFFGAVLIGNSDSL